MKKVYLFFTLAMAGCLTVGAQMAQKITQTGKNNSHSSVNAAMVARQGNPAGVNHPQTVIWADDFSMPANWTINHAAGTTGDWVIGPNPPAGLFPIDPINSTTSVNGFARFDSDSICSGDQIGNITTTSPIDLSAYAGIRLTFSQYYRRYHDSTYVLVSTDNMNWTKFEVNGNLVANDFSANNDANVNPEVVTVDISSVAGGQATVYIGFQFFSPDTNASGTDSLAGCGYAWMVDDVMLSDIPSVDARLLKASAGEYAVIPLIQPEAFQLRGKVVNSGGTPFAGAKILFTVFDINGTVYTDSSTASATINPGDTSAYLYSTGTFLPTAAGFYLVEQLVSLAGDGDNSNDTALADVLISDSTYARDLTAVGANTYIGGYGFNANSGSMGQMFKVYHASEFTSVTFFLASPPVGDQISCSVYAVSPTTGLPTTLLGTTPVYTLQPGDTVLTNVAFSPSISVAAGDYFVTINQLDTTNITIGASSEIYTFHKGYYKTLAATTWTPFESSNILASLILRVNNPSGTLLSVSDVKENSVFSIFPNPSAGVVYISGNGTSQKDVNVNVINGTGQIVKSIHFNSLTINRVDLSDLAKGLYTVQIQSGAGRATKSVLIN